ncbi:phosphatidylinositol 4-phosphate 5-kinase (macronuclear) [Tetrahymena thermophila SB210]|uniref:Phosphatidylinositol 4-phosphate 5-kinase n=1 Tax=Tetrahymena thermophila (strain SB210) TaxID=312017 RepID=Q22B30_TETTS|nr:phosphatidylinositol 4-phosphate 5-kinase [Tetrahymena thermophila SB210]EAR82478.2 phosphatidylinositol 4-phosphate 5-kinase [Tetrahymena thermophila SB210]|eukprot:XP_001030141.2 phosphatidylinositol 4-phosphate 5-kinase [Tetrahymena thermophila SB210]
MIFCCTSKTRRVAEEDEIRKAISKTTFSLQEVTELRQRFYRMSKNTGKLRKEQFREHMGVLGLDTVFFLSDRIFTMLDSDGDGQINFQDFINYFDIITHGNQEQKAQIAFNYIDTTNQGSFDLNDLKKMIGGIINSYCAVTGAHFNEEQQRRTDQYIISIFDQMSTQKNGRVTFTEYLQAIRKNPNILEIFEFLNKGIQETIKDDKSKEIQISKMVLQVENQIDQVIGSLAGEKEDSVPQNAFPHQQKTISFKRSSIRNINKLPSDNDIEPTKLFPLLTQPNIVIEEQIKRKDKSQSSKTQIIETIGMNMNSQKNNHEVNDSKKITFMNNSNLTFRFKSQPELPNSTVKEEDERQNEASTINDANKPPTSRRYGAECLKVTFVKPVSKYQNNSGDVQDNCDISDFTDDEIRGENMEGINEGNDQMDDGYINQNKKYVNSRYKNSFLSKNSPNYSTQQLVSPQAIIQNDIKDQQGIGQILKDNNKNQQYKNTSSTYNQNGKTPALSDQNMLNQQSSQKNILLFGGVYPIQTNIPQGNKSIFQQSLNSKGQIIDHSQQYIEGALQYISQNAEQVPIISFQSATQGQSSDQSNFSQSSQKNNNSSNKGSNQKMPYQNSNFINIQNGKLLSQNDIIISSNEQNLLKDFHNSNVNININNNFFLHHPHQISSQINSPLDPHSTANTTFNANNIFNNNLISNSATNNSSSISNKVKVPPLKSIPSYNEQQQQQQKKEQQFQPLQENLSIQPSFVKELSSEQSNNGANQVKQNINTQNNQQNIHQSNHNLMNNSNNLSISNSQISQGSNQNYLNKSGFFKEHYQKSASHPLPSLSPQQPIIDPRHKQFIKNVNDMSTDQLKEKILGLYPKFLEMKDTLKVIRQDLEENNNNDDELNKVGNHKDSIINDKNIPSFAGRVQRFSSNKNSSPQQNITQTNIFIRQNSSTNQINPQINMVNQDDQFRTMRISTAINVPNKKSQRNLSSQKNTTMVFFGHQNWNLVLNMMMGVQMAVRSVSSYGEEIIKLESEDFKLKYYFELLPRRRVGEQSTFKICKFSDYAPQVFRNIRLKYNISSENYLKSIGPEKLFSSIIRGDLTTLSELTSTGKSGSFFYYTVDSKFTLKTIHKSEFAFLKKILPNYYQHLLDNPNTLIIRVYGLHKIKYKIGHTMKYIYFIIMSNVFYTRKEIHERFDLKGSLYKRYSDNPDPSVAKKDLNFLNQKMKVQVRPEQYHTFMEVVKKDCHFFEQNEVIDYSMLLGLHNSRREKRTTDTDILLSAQDNFIEQEEESICLMKSRSHEITYHFGIIDILTCFNSKKKIEFLAKRIALGPDISTIPPQQYAARFIQFIENMFDDGSKKTGIYNQSQQSNTNNNNNINSNNNNINSNNNIININNQQNIQNNINNNNL